jgi:hypothetical protein
MSVGRYRGLKQTRFGRPSRRPGVFENMTKRVRQHCVHRIYRSSHLAILIESLGGLGVSPTPRRRNKT